jgi:hypothetical protein
MTIGASVERRSSGNSVRPSTFGIMTSRMITSAGSVWRRRSAVKPSGAARTLNPR